MRTRPEFNPQAFKVGDPVVTGHYAQPWPLIGVRTKGVVDIVGEKYVYVRMTLVLPYLPEELEQVTEEEET